MMKNAFLTLLMLLVGVFLFRGSGVYAQCDTAAANDVSIEITSIDITDVCQLNGDLPLGDCGSFGGSGATGTLGLDGAASTEFELAFSADGGATVFSVIGGLNGSGTLAGAGNASYPIGVLTIDNSCAATANTIMVGTTNPGETTLSATLEVWDNDDTAGGNCSNDGGDDPINAALPITVDLAAGSGSFSTSGITVNYNVICEPAPVICPVDITDVKQICHGDGTYTTIVTFYGSLSVYTDTDLYGTGIAITDFDPAAFVWEGTAVYSGTLGDGAIWGVNGTPDLADCLFDITLDPGTLGACPCGIDIAGVTYTCSTTVQDEYTATVFYNGADLTNTTFYTVSAYDLPNTATVAWNGFSGTITYTGLTTDGSGHIGIADVMGFCDLDVDIVPPTCPLPIGSGGGLTGGDGAGSDPYVCECFSGAGSAGENAQQVTITVSGGTAPYYIIDAVGLYDASTYPDMQALSFAPALSSPDGNFTVLALANQPFAYTVSDSDGLTFTFTSVCTAPEANIANIPSVVCVNDPVIPIYDEAIFSAGFNPALNLAGEWQVDGSGPGQPVLTPDPAFAAEMFGGVQDVDADLESYSATFDPFYAGPGQHIITYCIEYDSTNDPVGIVVSDTPCVVCDTHVINVFPEFSPLFTVPQNVCVDAGVVDLALDDIVGISAILEELEGVYDIGDIATGGDGTIASELDVFISWDGAAVTDLNDGTGAGTFDPAAAGPGDHIVYVTVGYPSCEHTFATQIRVLPSANANLADRTICAIENGGQFDLTALYDDALANSAGGVFVFTGGTVANPFTLATPVAGIVGIQGHNLAYNQDALPVGNTTVNVAYVVATDGTTLADIDADDDGTVTAAELAAYDAANDCFAFSSADVTLSNVSLDASFDLPSFICGADAGPGNSTPGSWSLLNYLTLNGSPMAALPAGATLTVRNAMGAVVASALTGTTFNAGGLPDGLYYITYELANGTCDVLMTEVVDVTNPPTPTLNDMNVDGNGNNTNYQVCQGSDAFGLADVFHPAPAGGVFTVEGVIATMFDPTEAGTFDVTYCAGPEINGVVCAECTTATITVEGTLDPGFVIVGNGNGNVLCSQDAGYPITTEVGDGQLSATADEVTDNSNVVGDTADNLSVTTDLEIVGEDPLMLPAGSIIKTLTFTYAYQGLTPGAQGDHNGYTVTVNGGVASTVVANVPDSGTAGTADDNLFSQTVTLENIAIVNDCEPVVINFNLLSNAADTRIIITGVTAEITKVFGNFTAYLNEADGDETTEDMCQLPAEAFTFDVATGQYTFNTRFVTAAGTDCFAPGYHDLAAYDEITVCFENVGDCSSALTDPAGDIIERCTSSSCQTFIIINGGNATLAATDICLSSWEPLHLPTAFWLNGITTPGGVWTQAEADGLNGVAEEGGNGVYGEFFYSGGRDLNNDGDYDDVGEQAPLAPGNYTVCYSLMEGNANCGQPDVSADCVVITVPAHYCIDVAGSANVCESCDESSMLPITLGMLSADGTCTPLPGSAIGGGTATGTVCRSELDANADGSVTDAQNTKPTSEDDQSPMFNAATATSGIATICGENYTVLVNQIQVPSNANITDIAFNYNYISTKGTAQGDHDGWGIYRANPASAPTCVGGYPNNATRVVGFGDSGDPNVPANLKDPEGDNHFPGAFPSTAFEDTLFTTGTVISAAQAVLDAAEAAGECTATLTYYYLVSSNSQYWDACFLAEIGYEFETPGATPAVVAYYSGTTNPVVLPGGGSPIVQNADGSFSLNTCGLGDQSIDIVFDASISAICGQPTDECSIPAMTTVFVIDNDETDYAEFTVLGASPSVCTGEQVTIEVNHAGGSLVFVDGMSYDVTDEDAATAGIQYTIPANAEGGLWSFIHTITTPNGCELTVTQTVLVGQTVEAETTAATTTVCNTPGQTLIDLTQYVTPGGGTFSGPGVVGSFLNVDNYVAGGAGAITYTIDNPTTDCDASVSFTLTVVDTAASVDFDMPDQACAGEVINLTTFATPAGGTFTANGTAIETPTAWTVPASGSVTLIYTVGAAECTLLQDVEVVSVINSTTPSVDEYGYICQSADDDFTVDLTEYLPAGASLNGGAFTTGTIPPFISEIEYDAQQLTREFVEITAPEGTDLSCYALFFYERAESAVAQSQTFDGNTTNLYTGANSGRVYAILHLEGVVGNMGVQLPSNAAEPTFTGTNTATLTSQFNNWQTNEAGVGLAGFPMAWGWQNTATGDTGPYQAVWTDVITDNQLVTAANGVRYGAVAFDPRFDIKAGAAGIALVNVCDVAAKASAEITNNDEAIAYIADMDIEGRAEFLRSLDSRANDDVVQFLGYGTSATTTNLGIFGTCDGPAAGLISMDINVVDQDGSNRSLQFTNDCWQVPNTVQPYSNDSALDYDEYGTSNGPVGNNYGASGNYGAFETDATGGGDGSPTRGGNAGVLNWGLSDAGADELYFDYIAPNGDILHLDHLCQSLFVVGQTFGNYGYDDFNHEENGGENETAITGNGGDEADEDGLVNFTCANPTYALPFNYQSINQCGFSAPATFNLVVLMDLEENWHAPKESVCESEEVILTALIEDQVHFIPPYEREGTFEVTNTETYEENVEPVRITEIHTDWYDYDGPAKDDHCIGYNHVNNNGTPFNNQDDSYITSYLCEGIEISGPVGADLSCYKLVIYSDENVPAYAPANALGHNVSYINEDGEIVSTDIVHDIYIDLWGSIDEDTQTEGQAFGENLIYVPSFGPQTFTATPELNGYPFYSGVNPVNNLPYGNIPGATFVPGLYVDANNNGWDPTDVLVQATDFPWERPAECPKAGVGSRWFPIVNLPDNIGGIALMNTCSGELLDFISWGEQLCVNPKEDFSIAGPFEQLTSTVIDTVQNNLLGDLRTIQLMSCGAAGLSAAQIASCPNCNEGDGTVWALVYNGGAVTISCGDGTSVEVFGDIESQIFSNTMGYFNCGLDPEVVTTQFDGFNLDLTPLLTGGSLSADYVVNGSLPMNAIVTGHEVTLQIGTGDATDYQLYQFQVYADNCGDPADDDEADPNVTDTSVWDMNDDATADNNHNACELANECQWGIDVDAYGDMAIAASNQIDQFCADCTGVNSCYPGELIDLDYDADCDGVQDEGDYLITDEDFGNNGYYDATYNDGNGEDVSNPNSLTPDLNNCYIGGCTATTMTDYIVDNLAGYIYSGNVINGAGTADSCRELVHVKETYTVSMTVNITYRQCAPVGNFSGTGVSFNDEDWDNPYWVFDAGVAGADGSPHPVTYNVANSDDIEADDVTDDLACLDDNNDNIRTQWIKVLPAASATLNASAISVCSNSGLVDLTDYFAAGTSASGTWSGTGVSGSTFNPATAGAGTHTVTYAVSGGNCSDNDQLAITVEAFPGAISFATPAAVCNTSGAVALSATPAGGTWSGSGVSGSSFNPAGLSGAVTLTYTVGTASCGSSQTTTINVNSAIATSAPAVTCSAAGDTYTVSFSISGGSGNYSVNGVAAGASYTSAPLASGSSYSFVVNGSGACEAVTVSGSNTCTPACVNPNAGTVVLVDNIAPAVNDGIYCHEEAVRVDLVASSGYNANYTQVYVVTTTDGTIAAIRPDGDFTGNDLAAGNYLMWGLNYLPGSASIPAIGENAANISGCFDLSEAAPFTILTPVTLQILDITCQGSNGYTVDVLITGGEPQRNSFGFYTISGAVNAATGNPAVQYNTVTTLSGVGSPFISNEIISIGVVGDGRNCTGGPVVITAPSEPCGLFAVDEEATTGPGESITVPVTDNDEGCSLVVTYVQPVSAAVGVVINNGNGTLTFVPANGFSGEVSIPYQVTDCNGQTAMAVLSVTVTGTPVADELSVMTDYICNSTTGEATVSVVITGGTPPYDVVGDLSASGFIGGNGNSLSFILDPNASSYYFVVTDDAGASQTINEQFTPCTKVVIDLLTFEGEVLANGNNVKWITSSETNNDKFVLYFSADGINYTEISTQDGQGNKATPTNYSFLHKDAVAGVNYYRLTSVDFDGTVTDHGVITLQRGESLLSFVNIYPVPAVNILNVQFSTTATSVKAEVYDVAGKLVAVKSMNTVNGLNTTTIDVTSYATGTYYLTINDGTSVATTKFVKE